MTGCPSHGCVFDDVLHQQLAVLPPSVQKVEPSNSSAEDFSGAGPDPGLADQGGKLAADAGVPGEAHEVHRSQQAAAFSDANVEYISCASCDKRTRIRQAAQRLICHYSDSGLLANFPH